MKRTNLRFNFVAATLAAVLCATTAQSLIPIRSHILLSAPANRARATTAFVQYDDPYSDFRNARYSNAALLNNRDEVKLGTQLNHTVTKKYPYPNPAQIPAHRLHH